MSQLKNVKVLTTCAMLLALATVLGFFKIPITNLIEIRFSSIPLAIGGALFGPVVGAVLGAASDILQFVAKPTGVYFPGFTLTSACSGFIFGAVLHGFGDKSKSDVRETVVESKETDKPVSKLQEFFGIGTKNKVTVGRVLLAEILVMIFSNMILNGINLSILYGTPFFATVLTRLPKQLVMIPVNTAIVSAVLIPSHKVVKRMLNGAAA